MSLVIRLFVVILLAWLVPALVVLTMMDGPVSLVDGWVMLPMLAALALALWAGQRWFARPLAGLSGVAGRWRAGNTAARTEMPADSGEIGHLARTFDELAGSAASVSQQLETARSELRRAEARARRLADDTARTLSAASHDLRQPLQAMNLSVSLLSSRHRADNDTAALGRISRSIQQLGHQIDLVVQTARLQAGLVAPKLEEVTLQPLVDTVAREFADVFEQKPLRYAHTLCDETVRTDPQLLTLVLRSLLANAVRYTPGGGEVAVGCEAQGEALRFYVRDTGVGMTADRRAEVLAALAADPDADAAAADASAQGLGTGLTLVRQAARVLGHPVRFESTLGEGSRFELELPRVQPAGRVATTSVASSEPVSVKLQGRVLVVEDDAQSEDGSVDALKAAGLKVVSALELEDAIDTLDSDAEAAGEGRTEAADPYGDTGDADSRAEYAALVLRRPLREAHEVALCRSIAERHPRTRLLLASASPDDATLALARQAGVTLLEGATTAAGLAASLAAAVPALVARDG